MANAMAATADDWASSYYNPAGGGLQFRPTYGVGYLITGSQITSIGPQAPDLDSTQGLTFGTNLPLPLGGFMKDRLAFGMALFLPKDLMLGIEVPYPDDAQYVLLQNAGRSMHEAACLGLRLMDGLAVGGGAQMYVNTAGELNASVQAGGTIQAMVGEELLMTISPTFGLLVKPEAFWAPLHGLGFGLVFRDRFFTRYDIPVNSYLNSVPFLVQFQATSLYTPRQYVAGLSYAWKQWRWEVDLGFNEWSDFPDPNLHIQVNLKIPILPVDFQNSIVRPPHFHDTLTPRAGMEVTALSVNEGDLRVRTGYTYEPSPVPPQTGYTNYLDTDRHIAGLSLGWEWSGVSIYRFQAPVNIDLGLQAQYLTPRITYKNDDVDMNNPGYPKIGLQGWLFATGLTFSSYFDYE